MSDSVPATVDGDAAWMLTSTALVYMMTPALAFFYGGLVDHKNILNQLFLSFICMGLVTVQWILFGYSFSFHTKFEAFGSFYWGSLNFETMKDTYHSLYAPTYSQLIHAMYQGAFAVITPALISGSVVGRMRLSAYVIFIFIWTTIVYDFLAHAVWAENGWLRTMGALDFAGGTVIHISSGFSGLVAAMILGKRGDYDPKAPLKPAHIPFTVLGAGLLWVGWMGFNGGSAGAANNTAGLAVVNTNAAAAIALLTWTTFDAIRHKASIVGACTGAIVGLVVITPAAGYVSPGYAILMGFIGTSFVYGWIILRVKLHFTVDDTLDAFSCHGLGGVAGAILTGLFAEAKWGGVDGAFFGNGILLWYQIAGVLTAIGWACAVTAIVLGFLQVTIGIRVSEQKEKAGLDHFLHGEKWELPSLVSAEMTVTAAYAEQMRAAEKKPSPSLLPTPTADDHKVQMDLNESTNVILSSFNNQNATTEGQPNNDDENHNIVTIRTD